MRGSRPSWIAARVSEKAPEITACAAITVATVAITTRTGRKPSGASRKNGSSMARGIAQDERALPEVVEHQRREHERDPGHRDRPAPEVAEIGVKRLRPSHSQEDGAEHHEGHRAMLAQEARRLQRVEGREHAGFAQDLRHAQAREGHEPDRGERPEGARDTGGAALLHGEEPDQDGHRQRHHVGRDAGPDELRPLHRREDRDRGRHDCVAAKQRRPRDAERQDRDRAAPDAQPHEGIEGEHPALAPVVGAQQEQHVLDHDDRDQRPDQQRQEAQHLAGVDARRPRPGASPRGRHRAGWCRCRRRPRRRSPRPAPRRRHGGRAAGRPRPRAGIRRGRLRPRRTAGEGTARPDLGAAPDAGRRPHTMAGRRASARRGDRAGRRSGADAPPCAWPVRPQPLMRASSSSTFGPTASTISRTPLALGWMPSPCM